MPAVRVNAAGPPQIRTRIPVGVMCRGQQPQKRTAGKSYFCKTAFAVFRRCLLGALPVVQGSIDPPDRRNTASVPAGTPARPGLPARTGSCWTGISCHRAIRRLYAEQPVTALTTPVRDRVRFATSSPDRPWKLQAEFHSPRYTTRWGELLNV